jgi:hypothetical protein
MRHIGCTMLAGTLSRARLATSRSFGKALRLEMRTEYPENVHSGGGGSSSRSGQVVDTRSRRRSGYGGCFAKSCYAGLKDTSTKSQAHPGVQLSTWPELRTLASKSRRTETRQVASKLLTGTVACNLRAGHASRSSGMLRFFSVRKRDLSCKAN